MRLPHVRVGTFVLAFPTMAILALHPVGADTTGEFTWNRKMLHLTSTPTRSGPSGTHDVVMAWTFEFAGEGTVADLSTDATLTLSPTGAHTAGDPCIIWDIKDSCAHACASDSCGTVVIDGVETTLVCGTADPMCHGPDLTGVFPGVPLTPGTVITVSLSPAEGAAPETDTSDDSLTITFGPTSVSDESWAQIKEGYR